MINSEFDKIENVLKEFFNLDFSVKILGGMTNKNYLITLSNNKKYVVKQFGKGTEKFINRKIVENNIKANQKLGLDVPLVKYDCNNAVLISEYIDNSKTLTADIAKDINNISKISKALKLLHQSDIKFENTFNVFDEIIKYESFLYKYKLTDIFKDYKNVRNEIYKLSRNVNSIGVDIVPCHNDIVPENILIENEKLYLIDWEYSGMNDPMFDIASYFLENNFSSEEEKYFYELYDNNISIEQKTKVTIYKISQDILWAIWAIYRYQCGVDYLQYGIDRYNRGVKMLYEYIKAI